MFLAAIDDGDLGPVQPVNQTVDKGGASGPGADYDDLGLGRHFGSLRGCAKGGKTGPGDGKAKKAAPRGRKAAVCHLCLLRHNPESLAQALFVCLDLSQYKF